MAWIRKLGPILRVPIYRWTALGLTLLYLVLFLMALGDFSRGGGGWGWLTVEWTRMFDRTGPLTFEAVAMLSMPGATLLLSPLNILLGSVLSLLAGLNLVVTFVAFRQPRACSFNRSTGFLASIPALLAGSACCAPTVIVLLGIQASSLVMGVFQVLIPVSLLLLVVTLKLVLDRTNPELLTT